MKKLIAVLAVMAVLAFASNAMAAVDMTQYITATATVGGVTTLTLTPATLVYGNTSANAWPTTPADNKIQLSYASNFDPWKIRIYTDNTNVPLFADGGPYSKGGLAKTDGLKVIPFKWIAQAGGTTAPLISTIGGYNYVKDMNDEDDPGQTGDQGWSETDGYPNIAYGGAGYAYCIDPTNAPSYQGDAITGSVDLFLGCLFGDVTPVAGSYSSKVYFDLMHE